MPLTDRRYRPRLRNPCWCDPEALHAAGLHHAHVEVVEDLRVALGNGVAYQAVVRHPGVPVQHRVGCQCGLGQPRDDCRLRQQQFAGRLGSPAPGADAAGAVLGGVTLLAGGLTVDLGAPQAGQEIGDLSIEEVGIIYASKKNALIKVDTTNAKIIASSQSNQGFLFSPFLYLFFQKAHFTF